MPVRIVLATHNAHKIQELTEILQDYPFQLSDLCHFPGAEVPEENGETYLENALIKARASSAFTGLPSLADDSGLEVDALQGQPGLHSARFGGPGSTQEQKIQLILQGLTEGDPRNARFRCVIAIVHPDGREWHAQGVCEGFIAPAGRGDQGFGYDPIFWLPKYAKTMAQLSSQTKNRISHRALAIHQVMHMLYEDLAHYPQM